jgi:predicted XRE-type DNA-binding protein
MDRKTKPVKLMKMPIRLGGSNIFADLKLPEAGELNAKAQIAYRICKILEQRNLTQKAAGALLGIDQPKVSALLRGRLDGFSSDRLFRFLNALDRDVDIVIRPVRKRSVASPTGTVRVMAIA